MINYGFSRFILYFFTTNIITSKRIEGMSTSVASIVNDNPYLNIKNWTIYSKKCAIFIKES
jgi:hypothetical protein